MRWWFCYSQAVCFTGRIESRAFAEAFAAVAREDYLERGPWQFVQNAEYTETPDADPRWLYHDVLFAIDVARKLNNGQPSSVASWLQELQLAPGERVFHIGSGLGYYTAIMAHVVGPTGRVLAAEIDPDLAARAQQYLAPWANVQVAAGDGLNFDPGAVDAIFASAGVTHPPIEWVERLRPGGRLLVPLTVSRPEIMGETTGTGYMLLVKREANGFTASLVSPVGIYSSPSGRDMILNQQLGVALQETMLGRREPVRSLRIDPHEPAASCWLHTERVCLSSQSLSPAED